MLMATRKARSELWKSSARSFPASGELSSLSVQRVGSTAGARPRAFAPRGHIIHVIAGVGRIWERGGAVRTIRAGDPVIAAAQERHRRGVRHGHDNDRRAGIRRNGRCCRVGESPFPTPWIHPQRSTEPVGRSVRATIQGCDTDRCATAGMLVASNQADADPLRTLIRRGRR